MREIEIEKVTLNMGVGEGGDKLAKAEHVLEMITKRKPTRTLAKKPIREWHVRRGEPIGCKVTLKGEKAREILERLFLAIDKRLEKKSFDDKGNFSFGIKEHIDVPGISYDPEIGIFGMDVSVALQRPGYRIKYRRRQRKSIPPSHRINKEEAIKYIIEKFGANVI